MNLTRTISLLALAASVGLSACSGGGAPTTATAATAPTSAADTYTGPAPATADVQAFAVNFWANVRVQNRCGQCHNATSPAQMPNFARSDNVNLAYAQANTVVNLASPATSLIVTKVSGGHNCWLADPSACGQILTTWISNWAGATGASSATQVQLVAPPVQTVGQSLVFPADGNEYASTIYKLTSQYCVRCHSSTASAATMQSPYFADPTLYPALHQSPPTRPPYRKIDLTGCTPSHPSCSRQCAGPAGPESGGLRHQFALLPALVHRQSQLLGQLRGRRGADARGDSGLRQIADSGQHQSQPGRQQGADSGSGHGGERRQPLRRGHHREVRVPDRQRLHGL